MTKKLIIAKDKAGVELGRQEEPRPETFAELVENFEEKDILRLAWAAHVIEVQAKLRAEVRTPSKESEQVKAFKKLTPEQQKAILDMSK